MSKSTHLRGAAADVARPCSTTFPDGAGFAFAVTPALLGTNTPHWYSSTRRWIPIWAAASVGASAAAATPPSRIRVTLSLIMETSDDVERTIGRSCWRHHRRLPSIHYQATISSPTDGTHSRCRGTT
jgi:hypothetical protein